MEFDAVMKGFAKRVVAAVVFGFSSILFFVFLYLSEKSSLNHVVVSAFIFFLVGSFFFTSLNAAYFLVEAQRKHRVLVLIARERDERTLLQGLLIEDLKRSVVHTILLALPRHDLLIRYRSYLREKAAEIQKEIHETDYVSLPGHFLINSARKMNEIRNLPTFEWVSNDDELMDDRINEINQVALVGRPGVG